MKKAGEDTVDGVFKLGKRFFKYLVVPSAVVAAGSSTVGATPLGQWLVTNYPETFSWLEPLLKLFL